MEDSPKMFWWIKSPTAVIYFLRELTGVGIAIYMTVFVVMYVQDSNLSFVDSMWFQVVSWLGLVSAFFHSLTWLFVTLRVAPFDLPKNVERAGFVLLLGAWAVMSYVLYSFLYVH